MWDDEEKGGAIIQKRREKMKKLYFCIVRKKVSRFIFWFISLFIQVFFSYMLLSNVHACEIFYYA